MKSLLVLLAGAALLTGCSDLSKADAQHCSPSYIKEVADTQGLEKARQLSSECVEAGFEDVKEQLRETGQSLKKAGEAVQEAGVNLKEELFGP